MENILGNKPVFMECMEDTEKKKDTQEKLNYKNRKITHQRIFKAWGMRTENNVKYIYIEETTSIFRLNGKDEEKLKELNNAIQRNLKTACMRICGGRRKQTTQ